VGGTWANSEMPCATCCSAPSSEICGHDQAAAGTHPEKPRGDATDEAHPEPREQVGERRDHRLLVGCGFEFASPCNIRSSAATQDSTSTSSPHTTCRTKP
jgi:hypothetical protein